MSQPGSYVIAAAEGDPSVGTWGEDLRRWREEVQKWSRKEFCEQVEATAYKTKEARGTKLDEKMVWRWESGQVRSKDHAASTCAFSPRWAPHCRLFDPPQFCHPRARKRQSRSQRVLRMMQTWIDEDFCAAQLLP
jgi:hypothetical protein